MDVQVVDYHVRQRRGITGDTALRLARYLGTDAQSWLNLQSAFDLRVAPSSRLRVTKRPAMRAGWRTPIAQLLLIRLTRESAAEITRLLAK